MPGTPKPGSAERRRAAVGVGLAAVVAAALLLTTRAVGLWGAGEAAALPDIVLILTDDQRWDSLAAMPTVRRELAERGVAFTNAFVVNPLCCPSRASTLTGQYPHRHGVWQNSGPYGGFERFDDSSTLATWLDARGYRTALVGKYLNHYDGYEYVPPGWDHWVAFNGSSSKGALYYRYWLNVNGRRVWFGAEPRHYSTDVLAARAVSFIHRAEGPLFLHFAPAAPHPPAAVAPSDAGATRFTPSHRSPSREEADVSDKPRWVRALPRLDPASRALADALRRDMLGSLAAVDRAVARILRSLDETGRLDRAFLVFTSDNGYSLGEHRWVGKSAPWEESIRVPLIVRHDPLVDEPREERRLALNVDLAPTLARLAGARVGTAGRSLLPLVAGRPTPWRRQFLFESATVDEVPMYCGLRTERHKLVAYRTGEKELYDLRTDPHELTNLAGRRAVAAVQRDLELQLKRRCRPPPPLAPPGFPG